jgi:branched-chain amino acid transport system permease protein
MSQSTATITTSAQAAQRVRALVQRVAATVIIAGTAIWLIRALFSDPVRFFSSVVAGFQNGALYALIALGYTLVYGIIELINFAHGDLFMLGTLFAGVMITTVFGQAVSNVSVVGWLAFFGALIACMAFCASINVTIEFLAYRRLRRAPKLAPLITAVGMSFILQGIGLVWNGSQQKSNWSTVLPKGAFNIGGVKIEYNLLVIVAVTVPLLLLMSWIVTSTKVGKAMRATAQDQDAARLMGINVNRIISFTFALGGALAGAAGLIYQQTITTTSFNIGFQLGLIAFTSAVLGGIGNLTGAVLGGVLIGVAQGLNDGVGLGQQWSQSFVFTILILLMVFRPTGLLGYSAGEKV